MGCKRGRVGGAAAVALLLAVLGQQGGDAAGPAAGTHAGVRAGGRGTVQAPGLRQMHARGVLLGRALAVRGGAESEPPQEQQEEETPEAVAARQAKPVDIVVTTLKMSGFVDQRCQVSLSGTATVRELREAVSARFPGRPPVPLLRLFSGLTLLSDDTPLHTLSQGPGRVQLVVDMPPPIDPEVFDPATAVPSNRDSQLEAYCANAAALAQVASGLQRALAGAAAPFAAGGSGGEGESDMACAAGMAAQMESLSAFLQGTYKAKAMEGGAHDGEVPLPPIPPPGPLHEALRPLALQFDVDWKNSVMMAFFVLLCAKFGAVSPALAAARTLVVAAIFAAQLRPVKYAFKVGYNTLRQFPFVTDLVVALLPAPDQVLLQFDERAYVERLYGPSGPRYRAEFQTFLEETADADGLVLVGDGDGSDGGDDGDGSD